MNEATEMEKVRITDVSKKNLSITKRKSTPWQNQEIVASAIVRIAEALERIAQAAEDNPGSVRTLKGKITQLRAQIKSMQQ